MRIKAFCYFVIDVLLLALVIIPLLLVLDLVTPRQFVAIWWEKTASAAKLAWKEFRHPLTYVSVREGHFRSTVPCIVELPKDGVFKSVKYRINTSAPGTPNPQRFESWGAEQ